MLEQSLDPGHAVRLLSYPDFLERLAERVARLRERFGWLAGSKGAEQSGAVPGIELPWLSLGLW